MTATLPSSPTSGSFGRALAGQYEVLRELGRGGMGVVYLARDLNLDRDVAIKTLPSPLANDAAIRERFLREARTAASLSHPNIVPVYRADEINGHVFFVMGYVEGESLGDRVRARGPLRMREVLTAMRDVAAALAYAHSHGVVHRDVKAENILLEHDTDRSLVTDFGIARFTEAAPITATGQVLGSVHYMSPEQVLGADLDGRSDIYSLGVVGYYALTGGFPFESDTASAVLVSHVNTPPPRLRDVAPLVPASVASIVMRCLAKSTTMRFQSGSELRQALDRVLHEIGPEGELTAIRNVPAVISEREAQQIWQRASELQSVTAARVAPHAPVLRARTSGEAASLSSGYRLGDVRDAALEAGIAPEFVDRALGERGLKEGRSDVRGPRSEDIRSAHDADTPDASAKRGINPAAGIQKARGDAMLLVHERQRPVDPLLGAQKRLVFDAIVEREMPERDFDILLEIIRRRTGEVGQVSAIGHALGWSVTDSERRMQLSIISRNGQTAIHVEEDLRPAARLTALSHFGGLGLIAGGLAFVLMVTAVNAAPPGFLTWAAFGIASFAKARLKYDSLVADRRAQLRELVEALVQQVSAVPGERLPSHSGGDTPRLSR